MRPEFQRMASSIDHKPNFRAVICYDESRWGRAIDAEENTYWRVYFRKRDIEVVLVKTSVDRNNEFAPMLSAFEGVQASQYSKKLSELTLRGAKSNGIYSNGGSPPYGYIRIAVNTKTGTERELKPGEWCVAGQEKVKWGLGDPEEIRIVQLIFERRTLGIGYLSIAMELNRNNISCPKRGRWRNTDQMWSEATVRTITENHSYYGARIYNRNSMSKILALQKGRDVRHSVSYPHWQNDSKDWVIVEGAHDPIVSKEIWMKAYGFRQGKDSNATRVRHKSPYLLSGLIRCSRCGFTFQGWTGKTRGKPYSHYIDSGWNNKRVCSHLALKKDQLEEFAIKAVKETVADPMLVENIENQLKILIDGQPKSHRTEAARITKMMKENSEKIQYITEAIERGGGSDVLLGRLRVLEQDQKSLELKLEGLKLESIQTMSIPEVTKLVKQFLENFEEIFERAPLEDRKVLMKKFIQEIIVDREMNVVRFYVRRIPPLTPTLERLITKEKKPTHGECVGLACSGGPIHVLKKDLEVLTLRGI